MFAPLARLLGLYSIKEELEELSFHFSEPEKAEQLRIQLEAMRRLQAPGDAEARQTLQALLERDPYLAARVERIQVECHSKALYSIWRCPCSQSIITSCKARDVGRWAPIKQHLTT